MNTRRRLLSCLVILGAGSCLALADPSDSIVKIYTVSDRPNYFAPWIKNGPEQSTGSGCVIKGRKILTNAHVVSDATFIQVRRHGQADRYTAHVASIAHDADLAILEVDEALFFKDVPALALGDLPHVQQEIAVFGFPMGGDTMSVTKGVVSRVEHQEYAHSGEYLLAVQIDAAINPGNSGGPAIVDGRIAGVAMMVVQGANNIGYIIPATIVGHFLKDIEDGHYDGFPQLGIHTQSTENPGLKHSLKIPDSAQGVLVTRVARDAPVAGILQVGDVIVKVDGVPVAADGTIELRKGERTAFNYVYQLHQIGDHVRLEFLRDGGLKNAEVALGVRAGDCLLVRDKQYDVMPTYYTFGGLIFGPLTTDYLQSWGEGWMKEAPHNLMACLLSNSKDGTADEVVLMMRVLPCDLNRGYEEYSNLVVKKVNGHELRDLRDMITTVENEATPFVSFECEDGTRLVIDRQRALREQEAILKTYGVPGERSADLRH